VESPQPREFGKRGLATLPLHSEPVKRSRHVALLVMGSLAIGGGAYALMPGENCQPKGGGMSGPSLPQTGVECPPRGSAGHGGVGGMWSRGYFFGGDPSSNRPSSATSSESGSTETTRGGFGGFARAIAAHFSGS
jgi:hypothetical protein